MFHTVTLFRALGIIEPIQSADQVTSNPADALKTNAQSDHRDYCNDGLLIFRRFVQ